MIVRVLRFKIICDRVGCGRSEYVETEWPLLMGNPVPELPEGWDFDDLTPDMSAIGPFSTLKCNAHDD